MKTVYRYRNKLKRLMDGEPVSEIFTEQRRKYLGECGILMVDENRPWLVPSDITPQAQSHLQRFFDPTLLNHREAVKLNGRIIEQSYRNMVHFYSPELEKIMGGARARSLFTDRRTTKLAKLGILEKVGNKDGRGSFNIVHPDAIKILKEKD